MLYAGIDIHKAVFQAVVLDPGTGELSACRARALARAARRLGDALAGEAGGGRDRGDDRLALGGARARAAWLRGAPGRSGWATALRGRRRQPKTDRLDARWLALLLARGLLSEGEPWLPPEEIQRLRDRRRLRKGTRG